MKISELREFESNRIEFDDIPDSFQGTWTRDEWKKDEEYEKDALFVTITAEFGMISQKYTPMHLKELNNNLEKMGITDTKEAIGKNFKWKVQKFRSGHNRWLPVELAE